ncbi:hypothetical protein R3W88_014568 [Solanum pinnatisectum]|uniref:DUF4283 domain-containing protein n=1 Tax=Solanum pinnatisectum TaxID=50273 RepID=A0AAV9KS27_9SOLN|nr:hypothetical protein R3W88_014568 [Solanum pinnatisectum]
MTIGSSIRAHVVVEENQPLQTYNTPDLMNEGQIGEVDSSARSEVFRRLSQSVTLPITSDLGRRSKVSIPSGVEDNGIVNTGTTVAEAAKLVNEQEAEGVEGQPWCNLGKENINEGGHKEPWANVFRNNRVAYNGMNMNFVPPQFIDGKTVVQLEEENVQSEEEKWRCALIAYVIKKCPGFNTMNRYIIQNWSSVAKPEVYLHKEGYYIIKFASLNDMHEIIYAGPYTINDRPSSMHIIMDVHRGEIKILG